MNGLSDRGAVLTGEALEQYARRRGLCHICATVQTHAPRGRFKRLRKNNWEPLTILNEKNGGDGGDYLVYKGFCIQPTCYSLKQAQRILGEASEVSAGSSTFFVHGHSSSGSGFDNAWMGESFSSGFGSLPDIGWSTSVQPKAQSPILQQVKRSESEGPANRSDLLSSWIENDSRKLGSNNDYPKNDNCTSKTNNKTKNVLSAKLAILGGGNSNTLGVKLLDFFNDPFATKLDLSEVRLTTRSIPSLLSALERIVKTAMLPGEEGGSKRPPLEELVLNKCHLGRNLQRLDLLIPGIMSIMARNHNSYIPCISLRDNGITKKGATSLAPLIATHTIQILDLSKNDLGGEGVSTILGALLPGSSNESCKSPFQGIKRLNLSRNKLVELSEQAHQFLRTNRTLQVLSLEGNFLRDSSIVLLAKSLSQNSETVLQDLLLGNNAFGDAGVIALAGWMQVSTSLKVLSIGKNDISNKGALALKTTLQSCSIKAPMEDIVGLEDNSRISDKALISDIEKQLEVLLQNRLFLRERSAAAAPPPPRTATRRRASARKSAKATSAKHSQVFSGSDPISPTTVVVQPLYQSPSFGQNDTSSRSSVSSAQDCDDIFTGLEIEDHDHRSKSVGRQLNMKMEPKATDKKQVVKNQIYEWIERNYSAVSSLVVSESDNDSITTRGSSLGASFDNESQRSVSLVDPADHIDDTDFDDGDWTSGICQLLGGPRGDEAPQEEGFEVDLGAFFKREALETSFIKSALGRPSRQAVRSVPSIAEDSLSSHHSSSRSSSSSHNMQHRQPRDDQPSQRRENTVPLHQNERMSSAPIREEEKTSTESGRPKLFRTRSALELEIEYCEEIIEAARLSDNPAIIRQGIESQKRLHSLVPLRDTLPDRHQLEDQLEHLQQKLRDPTSHQMMLEERLELASAKSLCVSLLNEESRLEAKLKVRLH